MLKTKEDRMLVLVFALIIAIVAFGSRAEADETLLNVYVESMQFCEPPLFNGIIEEVDVYMDVPAGRNCTFLQLGFEYDDTKFHIIDINLGPAITQGAFLETNLDAPLATYCSNPAGNTVAIAQASSPNPGNVVVQDGNWQHVFTLVLQLEPYSNPYNTVLWISCNTDLYVSEILLDNPPASFTYGTTGLGIAAACLRFGIWQAPESCTLPADCAGGGWAPCPRCPPDLGDPKSAAPTTTWTATKELYR